MDKYNFSGAGKSTLMAALANKLPGNNYVLSLILDN